MEISALDKANADRSSTPTTLPDAGADMFDQLLASLTEIADTYGEDEPAESDAPRERADAPTSRDDADAKPPNQDLTALIQRAIDRQSVPNQIPGTAGIFDTLESDAAASAQALAGTDMANTANIVASSAQTAVIAPTTPAAAAQATNALQQRANPQSQQSPQQQAAGKSNLEAGEVSLRAGRNEAMQQGNGQFQTSANSMFSADKAALASPANEQTAGQPNQQAERPAQAGDAGQLVTRPEGPSPEVPKTLVPVPPVPIAANAPTSLAPTANAPTNAPTEQTTQLAAGARTGAAQSLDAAKQPSASRQSAAARPQQAANQIAVHIRNGLKAGADTIYVRLNPEELGRVEVRMQIDGDKNVQAVVTVEKAEALEQLQRDSRILQRALEDAGFKSNQDSFTFEHNQSAPNQGGETPGERLTGSGGGDSTIDVADQESAAPANNRSSHDGLVDIEV